MLDGFISRALRSGLATAQKITQSGGALEDIQLMRWRGQDSYGKPLYASTLQLTALVEHESRRFRTSAGDEITSSATITILQPIPALSPVVAGRKEPVDERDKFVFANGTTGPILRTDKGLLDPTTLRPYFATVHMG